MESSLHDLEELRSRLAVSTHQGHITAALAEHTLSQRVVPDASGTPWRTDAAGRYFRYDNGTWRPADPLSFTGASSPPIPTPPRASVESAIPLPRLPLRNMAIAVLGVLAISMYAVLGGLFGSAHNPVRAKLDGIQLTYFESSTPIWKYSPAATATPSAVWSASPATTAPAATTAEPPSTEAPTPSSVAPTSTATAPQNAQATIAATQNAQAASASSPTTHITIKPIAAVQPIWATATHRYYYRTTRNVRYSATTTFASFTYTVLYLEGKITNTERKVLATGTAAKQWKLTTFTLKTGLPKTKTAFMAANPTPTPQVLARYVTLNKKLAETSRTSGGPRIEASQNITTEATVEATCGKLLAAGKAEMVVQLDAKASLTPCAPLAPTAGSAASSSTGTTLATYPEVRTAYAQARSAKSYRTVTLTAAIAVFTATARYNPATADKTLPQGTPAGDTYLTLLQRFAAQNPTAVKMAAYLLANPGLLKQVEIAPSSAAASMLITNIPATNASGSASTSPSASSSTTPTPQRRTNSAPARVTTKPIATLQPTWATATHKYYTRGSITNVRYSATTAYASLTPTVDYLRGNISTAARRAAWKTTNVVTPTQASAMSTAERGTLTPLPTGDFQSHS